MITLFIIITLILSLKIAVFALKAAWGITKVVFFVFALPVMLVVLFVSGFVTIAIPLLLIAIVGAILLPIIA